MKLLNTLKSSTGKYLLFLMVAGSTSISITLNATNAGLAQGSSIKPRRGPVVIAAVPAQDQRVSGPFTSGNLSVYLIHGKDKSNFQNFLTLQEGLLKGSVTVKETGDVNQLAVQNNGNLPIFIQSGDIVKGGRQDRTMQYDMILPPKSGLVPINSFCVEHGRWSRRGAEDAAKFDTSNYQLASKQLKMAAKYSGNQQQVWDMVDKFKSVGFAKAKVSQAEAAASPSPTSLELALENRNVKEETQKYVNDLQKVADGQNDVVGYAFAINGKVNSIDVYANNALFKKMWPKLINSSATEAFSESEKGKSYKAPALDEIQNCIADADKAKPQVKATAGKSKLYSYETQRNVLFETQDANSAGSWIHRNYMTK